MFDGFEMGMFPMIARPALQQMAPAGASISDAFVGHWMGVITALFLCGAALGGALFGWLGDRLGRVRAMSLSVLCYSVFTGAIYFCRTPAQLGALRFIAALGMGGEWSLGVALVMEVWPSRHRTALAGLIGAANNIGFALVAVAGLSFAVTTSTWRWVALIGVLPGFLALGIQRFVPESERWKAAVAVGELKPLREIVRSSAWRLTLLASVLAGIALIGSWGTVQWIPLWADQLVNGLQPKAKAYAQLATALGAIAGGFLGAFLAGKLGRRLSYAVISLASLGLCAALFRGVSHYGTTFLAVTFAVGVATTAFYGWLPLYLPELFPTRIRATAQGIAFNIGRLLAAAGALEMGRLMQALGGSYPSAGATISLVYVAGLIVIWFAPETKGRALPD
jgi:SHS family sialic acid transporter-like MFS transporter